ncbi:sugar phosphate isomerase/epimerase family protein [Croceicoccus marinus]|uniref:Sugar phosphate isomerase/epimerase n=1 Tax=Croceicoccus marinus TaxID=450378 RepID=A0A7G6W015_9SPHN|nr:sugar phosphate isomerase/epimerase [Croceicoccus marinus]QNE07330.1 sugar phosphate isomerase/epimerase [Croceicoccus marinus]
MAGVGAVGLGACAAPMANPPRAGRPLGLAQLTVAQALKDDYEGTLRRAKALGYTHFGFPLGPQSPRHGAPRDPVEVAASCRRAGLTVGTVRLAHTPDYPRQMQLAARLGAGIAAQSAADVFFTGTVPGRTTRADFERWMLRLGQMASAARDEGLRLVYHNHDWDHVPLDGLTPLELIAQRFAPGEVDFEIDLGWAAAAGVDPLALVEGLGPRVLALHLKDLDRSCSPPGCQRFVAPGEGDLDYAALMPRLDGLTDAIGYVEVDDPADGLLAAATGAATIRRARQAG